MSRSNNNLFGLGLALVLLLGFQCQSSTALRNGPNRIASPAAKPRLRAVAPKSPPPVRDEPSSPGSEASRGVLPEFLDKRILAVQSSVAEKQRAAEAFVADVTALPGRITDKVGETIEQVTYVSQAPVRLVQETQATVKEVKVRVEKFKAGQFGAVLGLDNRSKKDPYIAKVGTDLGVVKEDKGSKVLKPLEVYEGVKETVYLIADGVEGTGKAIVAVGQGIASAVRAAGALPDTVERTSASWSRTRDAVVADIEDAKSRASAAGEQLVRIVTLEDARERVEGAKASLKETQQTIQSVVDTITDVSDKLQGKRPFFPPPPPKPKSTTQKVLSAARSAAGSIVGGVRWVLTKKEAKPTTPTMTKQAAPTSPSSAYSLTAPPATRPPLKNSEVLPRDPPSISVSTVPVVLVDPPGASTPLQTLSDQVEMVKEKTEESTNRRSFSPYKSVREMKK